MLIFGIHNPKIVYMYKKRLITTYLTSVFEHFPVVAILI